MELVAPNLKQAGVIVTETLGPNPLIIHGNRLRIEQVMTNLLRNALDATDGVQDPTITVEAAATDDTIWYQVADNGHGLGDQSLDDIKEPFRTSRESGKGMGLGLTISAGIVEDHEGQMTAKNGPNSGAIFRASFPTPETQT